MEVKRKGRNMIFNVFLRFFSPLYKLFGEGNLFGCTSDTPCQNKWFFDFLITGITRGYLNETRFQKKSGFVNIIKYNNIKY